MTVHIICLKVTCIVNSAVLKTPITLLEVKSIVRQENYLDKENTNDLGKYAYTREQV